MTHQPQVHPAVTQLHRIIDQLGDEKVSDLHIHPGKKVRIEKAKKLEQRNIVFTDADIDALLRHCTQNRMDPLRATGHTPGSLDTGRYRARATFRRSTRGVTASFRVIGDVPDAETLGIPEHILNLARNDSGLIIVYGPTGSGKTALNSALLGLVNKEFDKHIYMIEEPIEFVHEEIGNSSIVQREVGVHTRDYPTALEDALRSKPHVIMVGEILNPATAKAALHAATTGHLVFTTAHAGSATEGLESFIGQFPADEQPLIRTRLSTSLLAVIVQRLVPTVDGRVVAAREVLMNTVNISDLIRSKKTDMIHQQLASSPGSNTMEASLADLVLSETISMQAALSAAKSEPDLQDMIRRRSGR